MTPLMLINTCDGILEPRAVCTCLYLHGREGDWAGLAPSHCQSVRYAVPRVFSNRLRAGEKFSRPKGKPLNEVPCI